MFVPYRRADLAHPLPRTEVLTEYLLAHLRNNNVIMKAVIRVSEHACSPEQPLVLVQIS